MDSRQQAINLYRTNWWETFLSNFKFWEEPYEVVEKMLPDSGSIVELGCGEGLMANYLALAGPKRKILGIELVPERLAIAKKGVKNATYRVGDITKLTFPKADVFILFHVLHHLPSKLAQEEVIAKVKESLKKDGKLIIVDVHVVPTLKYLAAWIADHFMVPWVFEKRFYTRAYFRSQRNWLALLRRVGFKVKVSEETKGRPFPNIIFDCKVASRTK